MMRVELIVSRLLIVGVILAAIIVILGGVGYFRQYGAAPVASFHLDAFAADDATLREPKAMLAAALSGDPLALMQCGVLLLMLTPVLRVALCAAAFLAGKDWLYAALSLAVLGLLGVSLLGAG